MTCEVVMPRRKITVTAADHSYSLRSPSKFKRKWFEAEQHLETVSKRLHAAEKREQRLTGTVDRVIKQLEEHQLVNDETSHLLSMYRDIDLNMFVKTDGAFSEEMKRFATTLKFYSAKAYDFVRSELHLPMPSRRTICRWLSCINGKPGFTSEAWALMAQRLQSSDAYKYKHCVLMLDEMSIRKHTSWNVHEGVPEGFVDLGTGCVDGDAAPVAKDVLVFMLVGIYGGWKLPVGYFLVCDLTADLQQNLLTECFRLLEEHNIECVAVICDGSYVNQGTFKRFGANFDANSLQSEFANPASPLKSVHLMFDVCHMIKLLRNALAAYKSFEIPGQGKICWDFIDKIHTVQKADGLRAANKLTDDHLQFEQAKMKVHLTVQVFSQSVATGIDFMRSIGQSGFEDSAATAEFIGLCDRLFDTLNSRSSLARGSKSPINLANFGYTEGFLPKVRSTLLSLVCADGKPLHTSKRRLCVIGLCLTIDSMLKVCRNLLDSQVCKYVLTYRFSQDHLELFFNAVRQSLGQNNNPTASQFRSAYRSLLTRAGVKPSHLGNVEQQGLVELMQISPLANCRPESDEVSQDVVSFNSMHDFVSADVFVQDVVALSCYSRNVLCYIAGFVVRKLLRVIHCDLCRYSLVCHSVLVYTVFGQ